LVEQTFSSIIDDRKKSVSNMIEIWLQHQKRYPLMQVQDYIKLLHQAVYGPRHASSQPDRKRLLSYLNEEIETSHPMDDGQLLIDIGNGYYRISIECVSQGVMSASDLSEAFFESMMSSPMVSELLHQQMDNRLNELLEWIHQGIIHLNPIDAKAFIVWYQKQGYPAIHHSDIYRNHYHPHYRVVHQDYILSDWFTKSLMMTINHESILNH
jgi:hypothetical protein